MGPVFRAPRKLSRMVALAVSLQLTGPENPLWLAKQIMENGYEGPVLS